MRVVASFVLLLVGTVHGFSPVLRCNRHRAFCRPLSSSPFDKDEIDSTKNLVSEVIQEKEKELAEKASDATAFVENKKDEAQQALIETGKKVAKKANDATAFADEKKDEDKQALNETKDNVQQDVSETKDDVQQALNESKDKAQDLVGNAVKGANKLAFYAAGGETALSALLAIASSTGRGEIATDTQKYEASELIQTLENLNPTPNPTESELIVGRWELVYASTQLFRSSPFFMAGRAVCSTEEEAKRYDWFCDLHRAALAISNIGAVRQIISQTKMVSEFEVKAGAVPFLADFTPFTYSGGLPITIDGAIVSSADITPVNNGTAWEIEMDTVEIKGSNLPGVRQVLDGGAKLSSRDLGSFLEDNVQGYTNPKPLFNTTFLSDAIRISRDQDGKVFVYAKVSDDCEPTDYSNVMADLGVAKLLEGFNDAITKFYL